MAVVGAGAEELGESDLVGRRNVHVLNGAQLEDRLEQLRGQQEPAEPESRDQRLAGRPAVRDALRRERLQ
jgi:hypothetical protein